MDSDQHPGAGPGPADPVLRAETAPPSTDARSANRPRGPVRVAKPELGQGRPLADVLRDDSLDGDSSAEPETPSEEDYDENIRPSLTQPSSTLRRRRTTEPAEGAVRRSDSGVHIIPDDDKSIQAFLERSSQRVGDQQGQQTPSAFRHLVFTRQFTTFDRNNEQAVNSPFHGFYNLFWLGVALFIVRIWAENWKAYGNPMGGNEIIKTMFSRDVFVLLLSDGMLFGFTGVTSVIQLLVLHRRLDWNRSGWIVQHVWQTCFFATFVGWTLVRDWPWTHSIFFVLHGLTLLMKQHSYAFYNGHLSTVYARRQYILKKLNLLERVDRHQDQASSLSFETRQAPAFNGKGSSAMGANKSDIDEIARAIASRQALDDEQIRIFERVLKWEVGTLTEELRGTASSAAKAYPSNLGLFNFYKWIPLPTVVYEVEYPRSQTIDWSYVAEKLAAMVGVIFVMIQISQHYIYPVVVAAMRAKELGEPLFERLQEFPWIFMDLMFPLASEYLLTWYLLWETILNVLAELTYFADRRFYDDWWNCVSWDQFARSWNIPVHNFLLRHVYHSSISSLKVHKHTATLITFVLSACVHELLMWCLFKKFRGYLFMAQMSQLPLVKLSRTRWLKGHRTLGNVLFWLGLFTGPGVLCSLYLVL